MVVVVSFLGCIMGHAYRVMQRHPPSLPPLPSTLTYTLIIVAMASQGDGAESPSSRCVISGCMQPFVQQGQVQQCQQARGPIIRRAGGNHRRIVDHDRHMMINRSRVWS